jgi:hypothetical protein
MSNIPYPTLVLALLISATAAADDAKISSPTTRQMVHCIMARAKASPNESYKTAFKVCREQFESVSREPPTPTAVNAMNNADAADVADSPKN